MAKDLLKSLASIEAEIQKLEKLQKTQVADSPDGFAKVTFCKDPDGSLIELVEELR